MALPTHGQHSRPARRPRAAAAELGPASGTGSGATGRRGELRVVDPVDLFAGLAATCVPAFCDGLQVDLATAGGNSVSASCGPAAQRTDAAAGTGGTAGRIVITVQSEPVVGEPPIAGTITCMWLDSTRPSAIDVVVARLLADQAVAKVRIDNIATKLGEQRLRVANLEEALATNREIGQAIGILMASNRLTALQAFERLRTASQHSHRKLRDVAADVTEIGGLAEPPGPTRVRVSLGLAAAARTP